MTENLTVALLFSAKELTHKRIIPKMHLRGGLLSLSGTKRAECSSNAPRVAFESKSEKTHNKSGTARELSEIKSN